MLFGLNELFRKRQPLPPYEDSLLGVVIFNEEEHLWEASVQTEHRKFKIYIAGKKAPEPTLLPHAREVASQSQEFEDKIVRFLADQASSFPGGEDEVRSLQLESLNLFWPNRPEDGMVYFDGGGEGRVWRCDYIKKNPVALGFDS